MLRRSRHARFLLGLSLVPWLAACGSAQGGQLEATTLGDLSCGTVPRGSPLDPFTSSCGEGAPKEGASAAIGRLPYVQRTTAHGTDVVFTADVAAAPIVDLSTVDGEVVASVPARRDAGGSDEQWVASLEGLESGTDYRARIGVSLGRDGSGGRPSAAKPCFTSLGESRLAVARALEPSSPGPRTAARRGRTT